MGSNSYFSEVWNQKHSEQYMPAKKRVEPDTLLCSFYVRSHIITYCVVHHCILCMLTRAICLWLFVCKEASTRLFYIFLRTAARSHVGIYRHSGIALSCWHDHWFNIILWYMYFLLMYTLRNQVVSRLLLF